MVPAEHEQPLSALAQATGGVDISLPVAIGLAAVLYLGLLFLAPEPRYVFGAVGPRLVPSREGTPPEVVEDPNASSHRQILRNRKAEASAVEQLTQEHPHA